MVEDITFTKAWTIALTGEFTRSNGVTGPAVVITENGGGSVRLKKKGKISWTNRSGRSVRLNFSDWPDEDGGTPDPVWPFSTSTGGDNVNSPTGSVTIADNGNFEGRLVGTGRILVKYTVYVLADGQVDETVLPLDPMIVVER